MAASTLNGPPLRRDTALQSTSGSSVKTSSGTSWLDDPRALSELVVQLARCSRLDGFSAHAVGTQRLDGRLIVGVEADLVSTRPQHPDGATMGPPDHRDRPRSRKATTSQKRLRQTGSSRLVSAGLSSGPNFESVCGGSTPSGAIRAKETRRLRSPSLHASRPAEWCANALGRARRRRFAELYSSARAAQMSVCDPVCLSIVIRPSAWKV